MVAAIPIVAVIVASATGISAQEAALMIPEGWVVSPENVMEEGEAGYRILHEETGIEMMYVPGGAFMMGSEEGERDEQPVHEVELSGFWIGWTEVTVGQWELVMEEVPFSDVNSLGPDHPVVLVTWEGCQEFCNRLGLRLPTEAEWEYAAAGSESLVYPWGDEWDGLLLQWNEEQDPNQRTVPVGSFPDGVSWCGALDMAGNVWEWCHDYYDESYYALSPGLNPTGPAEDVGASVGFADGSKHWWTERRVIRGGCFSNPDPGYFRCAMRSSDPSAAHYALGFRVARGL